MKLRFKFDCTECFKVANKVDVDELVDLMMDHEGHLIRIEEITKW